MSRILRRPMFRGGRVDGRGTGISSGLGYAQGGSVQDRPGYGLGGALLGLGSLGMKYGIRPAMKYAPKAWQGTKNLFRTRTKDAWGRTLDQPKVGLGQKIWQSKLNPFQDPFIKYPLKVPGAGIKGAYKLTKAAPYAVIGGGTAAEKFDLWPGEGSTEGWMGKTWDKGKEMWEDREEIWDDKAEIWDKYNPFAEEDTPLGISQGEANAMFGEGTKEAELMVGQPREVAEALLKQKLNREEQALIDAEKDTLEKTILGQLNKKKTKKEKLAEMKENKEMLQEMYGTGRGEDASRMLMSAASRLLEPEATVKSGLGKFLGDEAKVESKRSKYKDAATTGAIQMYLTGEKSFNDTMKAIELFKAQKEIDFNMKDAAKKDMSITEIKNTFFTSGSMKDREKTKGAAELWVEWNAPSGTSLTVIEGDEETPEYLQDPANEGKYIMNHETKEIFKIVEGIKKILYGG